MGKARYEDLDKFVCCACHSPEHIMRFSVMDWGVKEAPSFDVCFALEKFPLWKRIIVAIKYIFGYESQYGHFDEIVLGDKQVEEIQQVINHYWKLRGQNGDSISESDSIT